MEVGNQVVEVRKSKRDGVKRDIKRPSPASGLEPGVSIPDVLVVGEIMAPAEPEACDACGHDLGFIAGKWQIHWDDGRDTVQHEDSLRIE
jgi:hypothetical protein